MRGRVVAKGQVGCQLSKDRVVVSCQRTGWLSVIKGQGACSRRARLSKWKSKKSQALGMTKERVDVESPPSPLSATSFCFLRG